MFRCTVVCPGRFMTQATTPRGAPVGSRSSSTVPHAAGRPRLSAFMIIVTAFMARTPPRDGSRPRTDERARFEPGLVQVHVRERAVVERAAAERRVADVRTVEFDPRERRVPHPGAAERRAREAH